MASLRAIVYVFVALAGTAVVLTREPRAQILVLCYYGLMLTLLFALLQAPDVALSQITVGVGALPLMVVVALAEMRRHRRGSSNNGAGAGNARRRDN